MGSSRSQKISRTRYVCKYVMTKDGVDEADFWEHYRGFQECKKDRFAAEVLRDREHKAEGSSKMKSDRCGKEDVPGKRRHLVGLNLGRNNAGIPIIHYECESGHRFHFPAVSRWHRRHCMPDLQQAGPVNVGEVRRD